MDVIGYMGGKDRNGEFALVKADNTTAVKLPHSAFVDVVGNGEGAALKVGLLTANCGAMIGIWNCRGDKAKTVDVFRMRDVAEALAMHATKTGDYALRFSGSNSITLLRQFDVSAERQCNIAASKPIAPIRLMGETCLTASIVPIIVLASARLAVFGLIDKYASLCAVKGIKVHPSKQAKMEGPIAPATPAVSGGLLSIHDEEAVRSDSLFWKLCVFVFSGIGTLQATILSNILPIMTLYARMKAIFTSRTIHPIEVSVSHAGVESRKTAYLNEKVDFRGLDKKKELLSKQHPVLTIETSVAGKLAFMMVEGNMADHILAIEGKEVESKHLSKEGDCYVLDMESAITGSTFDVSSSRYWRVELGKR